MTQGVVLVSLLHYSVAQSCPALPGPPRRGEIGRGPPLNQMLALGESIFVAGLISLWVPASLFFLQRLAELVLWKSSDPPARGLRSHPEPLQHPALSSG